MDVLERDFYEERRRKWRRSAFWKGVLVTVVGLFVILTVIGMMTGVGPTGPHIAEVNINGVIYDDPRRDELMDELAHDENVKAVIVRISSPGGTIVGSEALYLGLREISGNKPIVAVMGEVAASGGYLSAIGTDHIIARGNTMTGSIGVIMEFPVVTELMDTIGVRMQTIRSSDQKAALSPFREASAEAIAAEQVLIDEANDWFQGLVSDRRNLQGAELAKVATGGVFSGRMAIENGLVDEIGGQSQALSYLESVDPDLANLQVEPWTIHEEDEGIAGIFGKITGSEHLLGQLSAQPGPRLYAIMK